MFKEICDLLQGPYSEDAGKGFGEKYVASQGGHLFLFAYVSSHGLYTGVSELSVKGQMVSILSFGTTCFLLQLPSSTLVV